MLYPTSRQAFQIKTCTGHYIPKPVQYIAITNERANVYKVTYKRMAKYSMLNNSCVYNYLNCFRDRMTADKQCLCPCVDALPGSVPHILTCE